MGQQVRDSFGQLCDVSGRNQAAATLEGGGQIGDGAGHDGFGHGHTIINFHRHLVTRRLGVQLWNGHHIRRRQQLGEIQVGNHRQPQHGITLPLCLTKILWPAEHCQARSRHLADGFGQRFKSFVPARRAGKKNGWAGKAKFAAHFLARQARRIELFGE